MYLPIHLFVLRGLLNYEFSTVQLKSYIDCIFFPQFLPLTPKPASAYHVGTY